MDQQVQAIQFIRKKVEKLLKDKTVLQKNNQALQEKLAQLQIDNAALLTRFDSLERQNLLYKSSVAKLDGADKKKLEQSLSNYISQINKAIALLSE